MDGADDTCKGRVDVSEGKGTGALPADSRTDGSVGGGPTNAHLRDSYFERMNDSILLNR